MKRQYKLKHNAKENDPDLQSESSMKSGPGEMAFKDIKNSHAEELNNAP
jgi:hypothetical protein